jgi:hypothetical protein
MQVCIVIRYRHPLQPIRLSSYLLLKLPLQLYHLVAVLVVGLLSLLEGHAEYLVVVAVRTLPFVEALLLLVVRLFVVALVVLRADEGLGVLLVHGRHNLTAYLGFGSL